MNCLYYVQLLKGEESETPGGSDNEDEFDSEEFEVNKDKKKLHYIPLIRVE